MFVLVDRSRDLQGVLDSGILYVFVLVDRSWDLQRVSGFKDSLTDITTILSSP